MRPFHAAATWTLCLATVACGASVPNAAAQPHVPAADAPLIRAELDGDEAVARALREHYTKYEHRIPMRDGACLFTAAYIPKDRSRRYPILLLRTPYGVGPYGANSYPDGKNAYVMRRLSPSVHFIRQGYVLVHQDVRGRMMSEGTFVDVRPLATSKGQIDESTDAYDTVDWLVKNLPANNGRVGVWGISYPGFYAAQAAVGSHPAVRAVSPQAPVTDWFMGDDFYHNGAFFLAQSFDFLWSFGKERPKPTKKSVWGVDHDAADVYDFFLALGPLSNANARYLDGKIAFWNDLLAHPVRDAFWKARDPRPRYKDVKAALMTVGGWFDAEDLFGALETYRAFEKGSARTAENVLVMGPWRHGGWARTDGDRHGDVTFGQKTSLFYREHIELPFFRRHLEGKPLPPPPEAWIFQTGTNTWERHDAWPPQDVKPVTLHLRAGGKLSAAAPPAAAEDETGADSYVSDPGKPVPYRARLSGTIDSDFMSDDQRFAARRPDVLAYETGELTADVAVAGPVEVTLWVSTTGSDADFVVKLVDVYPQDHGGGDPAPGGALMGGYQQLVRAEVMRARFRNGFESPEPMKPAEPALVRFSLPDVSHTFRSGHAIMVQVQSSWFPLVDRNPQTFVEIPKATEADFKPATHRVYRTRDRPSGLRMLVRGALPALP